MLKSTHYIHGNLAVTVELTLGQRVLSLFPDELSDATDGPILLASSACARTLASNTGTAWGEVLAERFGAVDLQPALAAGPDKVAVTLTQIMRTRFGNAGRVAEPSLTLPGKRIEYLVENGTGGLAGFPTIWVKNQGYGFFQLWTPPLEHQEAALISLLWKLLELFGPEVALGAFLSYSELCRAHAMRMFGPASPGFNHAALAGAVLAKRTLKEHGFGAPAEPQVVVPPPLTCGEWRIESRPFREFGYEKVAHILVRELPSGRFWCEATPEGAIRFAATLSAFKSQGPRYTALIRIGDAEPIATEAGCREYGESTVRITGDENTAIAKSLHSARTDVAIRVAIKPLAGAEYQTRGTSVSTAVLEIPPTDVLQAWRSYERRLLEQCPEAFGWLAS